MSDSKIRKCSGLISTTRLPTAQGNQTTRLREDIMNILRSILAGAALTALGACSAWAETKVQLVEVITSPQRTEFLKSQLAEFEKANPDIKVDVVSLPWGQAFEKFLNMVQAGETPDIVEMPERWLGLYANNGQLEDLGPYMKDWGELA